MPLPLIECSKTERSIIFFFVVIFFFGAKLLLIHKVYLMNAISLLNFKNEILLISLFLSVITGVDYLANGMISLYFLF